MVINLGGRLFQVQHSFKQLFISEACSNHGLLFSSIPAMNNNSECYAIAGCHANELSNGRMVHLAKK